MKKNDRQPIFRIVIDVTAPHPPSAPIADLEWAALKMEHSVGQDVQALV